MSFIRIEDDINRIIEEFKQEVREGKHKKGIRCSPDGLKEKYREYHRTLRIGMETKIVEPVFYDGIFENTIYKIKGTPLNFLER